MSLLVLQRDFRHWLRTGDDAHAARFAPGARAGLAVYQNNYRAQLVACLETSFPVTLDWLGGAAFHAAVVDHIDAVPPSSWTLDAYSRDFPATLERLYPGDLEVSELAVLELALSEAFVAPDADIVSAARLAVIDWDKAVLCFTPSLDVHRLTTNAPAIWSAITDDTAPPAAGVLPEYGALIVWRQDHASRFRTTDRTEMRAILRARGGATFAQLCETLVANLGEEAGVATAGQWLGQWIADGIITDILG